MDSQKGNKEQAETPFQDSKWNVQSGAEEEVEKWGVLLKLLLLGAVGAVVVQLAGNHAWVSGAILGMAIYLWQKAGRKADEQSHAGREALFEKLAESLPGMVYQCRQYPTGRCVVTYANSAMRWIYEKDIKEMRKDCSSIIDLVHPDDRSRVWSSLVESTLRLTPWKGEYRVMLPKQGMRWRYAHAQVERLSDGSTLWHGFIADVTWRKEMEERMAAARKREVMALKMAKETAEKTERRKTEFLAVMNHEIRTPLNGILGFADLLESSTLDKDQLEYVQTIRRCGDRLLAMINDTLDLTKIEAGRFEVQAINFDLRECISETFELLRPKASAKKLAYSCTYENEMPKNGLGDPLRVAQVLTNLLGNALKFTETGRVSLKVRTGLDDDHRLILQLVVEDTGPGVSAEDLEKIFDPYYQANVKRTDSTGLGLAISRKLCQLMGGDLTVESELGKGARFIARVSISGLDKDRDGRASIYADSEDASTGAPPLTDDAEREKAPETAVFSIL